MIEVLLFTEEQRNALRGEYNGKFLEPQKDGLDRWIVGLEVLSNDAFSEIHEQLNLLDRVFYCYLEENGNLIYPQRNENYSLFNDGNILCYKIPEQLQSITEKQYGSYYLPKVLDMNGNIIAPIWIAYDDNFMEIWVELRSLEKIKYKPQV